MQRALRLHPAPLKTWLAITLRVTRSRSEFLSAILSDLQTLGVHVLSEGANDVAMKAYFQGGASAADRVLQAWSAAGQPARALRVIAETPVAEEDWVGQWRRDYRPIRVGRHFLIVPSWLPAEPAEGITTIILDPQNAFGSGTHASTRLCLLGIAEHYRAGTAALDVGTGSGILAIAMARWGRKRPREEARRIITAIDPDGEALQTARNNARRNGVKERIEFRNRRLENFAAEPFPFVVANLTALDLEAAAPRLVSLCRPGGLVLLSGLQNTDAAGIRSLYRRLDCRALQARTQEGWSLLVMRREDHR